MPWSPWGTLNAPTLTQPFPKVQLFSDAAHKLPSITYPSPTVFVVDNDPVFAKAPLIRMVQGATPPMVAPAGIEITPLFAEIVNPPIEIEVFPQVMCLA